MAKRKAKIGDVVAVDIGNDRTFNIEILRGLIVISADIDLGTFAKSSKKLCVGGFEITIKEQKL